MIPLKVLFVATEAAPFMKVGGLGEVMFSLPVALRQLGHDARVMIPRYASIDTTKFPMTMVKEGLQVPSGYEQPVICNVKALDHAFFLENQEYYEKRANVYGYDDDAVRWALLCRGTIEFIRANEEWRPDVIVACDWQGGLLPNYIDHQYKDDPIISKIPVVFSIHNLFYQGMFDHNFVSEMDYDDGQSEIPAFNNPRLLKINFMRRGIMHADVVNTVSPTYAKEITTPEYGERLDALLQERRSRLFGILNGLDYEKHNPETDPHIDAHYSAKKLSKREKNKFALRQRFNLPQPGPDQEDLPILAIVSRLSEQKGLDLVQEIIDPMLTNTSFQLVVLGTGDSKYLSYFQELDKKYPAVAAHLTYDDVLPHLIYAGADAILIPSKYEPCGLTQMEAMRYGVIPIVRKTGGLADSVEDYHPRTQNGTGFVFENYTDYALYGAVVRALEAYRYPKVWAGLQKRAMAADFSWTKSAQEYLTLFHRALVFHTQSGANE